MVVFIIGAAAGLLIGLARGGRLQSLTRHAFHRPLLAVGVGFVLGLTRLGLVGDAGALLAFALAGAVVVALSNRHLAGMGVIAVGLMANLVPIALDGGTPVEPRAWRSNTAVSPALSPTQHLADHRTSIPVLSSRIPLPVGSLRTGSLPTGDVVVSFGDLVIAVGLASVAANATRSRRVGIPVAEILAGGPLTVDLVLSDAELDPGSAPEVVEPIAIPSGWEPAAR